jgi:anti-sigma-K factor RskA
LNLLRPERLDALAQDYALGLMHGGARRRFERLLHASRAAEMAVLVWQERLATLAAPVPPLQPSPAVWQRLEQRMQPMSPMAAAASRSRWAWLGNILSGRTLGGALAGLLLALVVLREQPGLAGLEPAGETLPASYVGLLLDQAGKPTLLASSRRHGRSLTVKLLQPIQIPAGQVAALWALPKDGGAAFKVGVVPAQGSAMLALPAPAEKLFFGVSRLAVTYELDTNAVTPAPAFVLSGHCVKLW